VLAPSCQDALHWDSVYHVLYGVLVPAGTLDPVVMRLNSEINRILQAPEMRASLASNGVEIRGGTSEQFAAFLEAERITGFPASVKYHPARGGGHEALLPPCIDDESADRPVC